MSRDNGNNKAPTATEMIVRSREEKIMDAARIIIGTIRAVEHGEAARSTHAEMFIEVDLGDGGRETWNMTIQRTSSTH